MRSPPPSFRGIFFMPSCPILSPSFKFSKKPQTISGNLEFSIRLKSLSCALDAIESNPTGRWAFGDAQNLPVRLQDGFQKTPTKLSSPNRPNSKPGNSWMNPDSHLWNSFVNVNAKCGSSEYACKVFGEIPERDAVSWTALIAGKPSLYIIYVYKQPKEKRRKMVWWLLLGRAGVSGFLYVHQRGFIYQQKFSLVNVKLKWVKDRALDAVVAGERNLRATCTLVSIISSDPHGGFPIYRLSRHRGQLGLPHDIKLATFIRRFPNIFDEFHVLDSGGTRVPWFRLTPEALNLHHEALNALQQNEMDLLNRLRKLLMLTCERMLPLQTIDQLKWDLGLPYDYCHSLVPSYPELFSMVHLPDDRVGLKLISWDDRLAVSQLQKNAAFNQKEEDVRNGCLTFPIGFTRGFGLKRKCMKWLEEWQMLPYTSPYTDASHLDPRTDVSEKRIVGVFHELLHLTLQKRTERKNVSNLRKPLSCPQKFTKVFERHPGIFYISKKSDSQTVVLREAYDRQQLLQKHPIVEIRERFANMMEKGLLDRSRGLYKRSGINGLEVDPSKDVYYDELNNDERKSESESDCNLLSEYDSDETMHGPC